MQTINFYHAGCPVCLSAEQGLLDAFDSQRYRINSIHLGEHSDVLANAKAAGVKSVPAMELDGQIFHINFGAAISDLES